MSRAFDTIRRGNLIAVLEQCQSNPGQGTTNNPWLPAKWYLKINEANTKRTDIHKRNKRAGEDWRMTRKLGSLLGDVQDVARRKQLAALTFWNLWSLG